jgi:uncharacterized protein
VISFAIVTVPRRLRWTCTGIHAVTTSLPMIRFPLPVVPDPLPSPAPRVRDRAGASHGSVEDLLASLAGYARDGLVVAFSGGVDSAFLLWAAREAANDGGRLVALTTVSASMPQPDLEDARRYARALEVEHVCVESDELASADYARNDRDRCYHCKADLFRHAAELARTRGMRWIAYGYTASDHHDVRPGHRAALEGGVAAPLSDHGFGKARIRDLMRDLGFDLADKPASPCLSSRIMTGIEIDERRLRDVAAMEAILRRAGVRVCRARVCEGGGAHFFRIEVHPDEMDKVLGCRTELEREGSARGYRWVTLDLSGYRTGGGTT